MIEIECYDINEGDLGGHTPLAWAAHSGHEEVTEVLLEREEVSPDESDYRGRTPLLHAVWNGHEEVVKILLMRGDVNPTQTMKAIQHSCSLLGLDMKKW